MESNGPQQPAEPARPGGASAYPLRFSVDYPDRPLNRLTSFFRVFTVIPIAIVLGTVAGGSSSIKDVRKWHAGQLGGCFKSVCCLLDQDHRGTCVFQAEEQAALGKRSREQAGVEFESNKTPVHRERRRGRFAGQDPLVSLLNLLE